MINKVWEPKQTQKSICRYKNFLTDVIEILFVEHLPKKDKFSETIWEIAKTVF